MKEGFKSIFLQPAAAGIIVLLFASPFFKGLFIKEYFFFFLALLTVLSVLTMLLSTGLCKDRNILWLFMFQLLMGVMSFFTGINKQESLYGLFLSIFSFLAFMLVLNGIALYSAENKRNWHSARLIAAVFTSGVLIALVNFIIASRYHVGTSTLVRLGWVIPYSNTLSVFLFVCSIAGFSIYTLHSKSALARILIRLGTCTVIAGMLLTYSRTMWVMSIPLSILYLLLHRNLEHTMGFCATAFFAILLTMSIAYSKWSMLWPAYILLILLILAYEINAHRIISKFREIGFKKHKTPVLLTIGLLLLVAAIASIPLIKSTSIFQRLSSISLNASELRERFAYYADSIGIIKDYIFTGTGHGGWSSIQYQYQTALYATKYAHSSLFQAMLDYGLPGLAIYASHICLLIIYFMKAFKKHRASAGRTIIIFAFLCNISLLFHSLLDIDFEFPLVNLVFWSSFAILSFYSGNTSEIKLGILKYKIPLAAVLASITFVSSCLGISYVFYNKSIRYLETKQYTASESSLKSSLVLNPIFSGAYHTYGELCQTLYRTNQSTNLKSQCIAYYNKAQGLDSKNPKYTAGKIRFFRLAKDFESSIPEYRDLINLQPLAIEYYEGLAEALCSAAERHQKAGNTAKATDYFTEITGIESLVSRSASKVSAYGHESRHKVRLHVTPKLAYNIGKAYIYLCEIGKAETYFKICYGKSSLSVAELRQIIK